jgi:hypothetical protein
MLFALVHARGLTVFEQALHVRKKATCRGGFLKGVAGVKSSIFEVFGGDQVHGGGVAQEPFSAWRSADAAKQTTTTEQAAEETSHDGYLGDETFGNIQWVTAIEETDASTG